ncbi:MAG: amidohydrolase family protein [Deltaproteobacteria bacterium]|nr:amidohydrolase family protein [Deltaproteobacteria bacterium]
MARARSSLTTPAFWDLHLHGVAGIDFMTASSDAMAFACAELGKHGTGAFAPTLLTAEPRLLTEACRRWGTFLEHCARNPRWLPKTAALPLGLHLEGPFLNPMMAGAHPKRCLRRPSPEAALGLVREARGHVAIVTLAPELPGAPATIRRLVARGIRVQLGHTLASADEAARAVRAGASGITHLYNAMRTHHRSPGVLTPLARGHVTAEIITDGLHLDRDFVRWCCAASPHRLYAVSDGCSAVGARAGQRLTLGSLVLKRVGDAAVVASNGILAGGATYLTGHPRGFASRAVLPLFYELQRGFFPRAAAAVKLRNHFDARSLRFLEASV